ncbi:hypothetical protein ONS96_005353 [Cadophora gregata f. sp. sojae]|nr:hypothetical protein ONS96_005353 [Cadophora gregata f. sp. sojae]
MWGKIIPLRTLQGSYQELKSGIPMWRLSKNFAHAIIITRELKLRYLWIDSLCIIQDLASDWNKEAATMHKVYSHVEVTIVATSATSTHNGFLERNVSTVPATKIHYSLDDLSEPRDGTLILTPQDDIETGLWFGDIEGSAWNTRGWTMQERSLSTRSLHFCKNKLYFECQSCRLSEEGEPLQSTRRFELWPRYESAGLAIPTPGSEDTYRKQLYDRWTSTVMRYCRRQLTKDFDKLLAIKSVAAEMSMRIADTYIPFAGMWNGNLHFDLLWRALRDLSKPEQYRAPSWSWAAIDGPINWVNDLIDVHQNHTWLQRLPFSIIDLGESGLGVDRPFLKVRALLVPVAFIEECDHDERWLYGTRILPYDMCIQSNKSTVEDQGKNIESLSLQDSFLSDINDGVIKIAEAQLDLDDTDNLTKSPRKLFYLHIQHTCRCTGLILGQEDENIELWKRVGVASICKTAPYSPFCPEFFEQHLELREVTLV